jgi:hypothetical protein
VSAPTRPDTPPSMAPPPPEPPPRTRPAAIGWGLVLIAAGFTWLLALAGVSLPWELVLPIAVIVVGLVLLVTRGRRSGDGLVFLGVVLTIAALVVTATPQPPSASAGERTHRVTDVAGLEDSYGLGAGQLTLDLRDLALPDGTTAVAARVGLGELRVRVPDDVAVTGTAAVTAGEAAAFDRVQSGISPRLTIDDPGSASAGSGGPVLELDLDVGLGQIEVTR